MNQTEIQQLIAQAAARRWLPLMALAVGLVVRLSKEDVPWFKWPVPRLNPLRLDFVDTPSRARPWLALGLGLVAGAIQKAASGIPWRVAVMQGITAGVTAILGHNLVVDSARAGKDIPVPGMRPVLPDIMPLLPDTDPETPLAKGSPR